MDILIPNGIISGVLSSKKNKNVIYDKAKINRVNISGDNLIQVSLYTSKQVFHKNLNDDEFNSYVKTLLNEYFNIAEFVTNDYIYGYRITSKGRVLSNKRKNNSNDFVVVNHNKTKDYILQEGNVVPALVDLGVETPDGKVVKAQYDKFKQINRFLEIIDDSISDEDNLRIIDFGCGKSYLTFILYYYITEIKHKNCNIIGLDLKEDVINHCNQIATKYGYNNLHFYKGDIASFNVNDKIDMIVTLHACDTATDYALYHAINLKCKYIFSVPCCQHEINSQLKSDYHHLLNKFGILKERYSALITDAIRANILQYYGYKTQVMEFVDFENSPKNLLIRAELKNNSYNEKIKKEIDDEIKQLGIKQTLYSLCFEKD